MENISFHTRGYFDDDDDDDDTYDNSMRNFMYKFILCVSTCILLTLGMFIYNM